MHPSPFLRRRGRCASTKTKKRAAVRSLVEAPITSASATDLLGFLQSASEQLRGAPSGSIRVLRVVTDGFSNVAQRIAPDFTGTHVTIAVLQVSNNVDVASRSRDEWKGFFMAHGAIDVTVVSAEGGTR